MTDDQVNAMVASYVVNRYTGYNQFQCYNLGFPGEHC